MLWGLYTLGFDEEANDFFYFIRDVAAKTDDELQIMYGIGGEETLTEEMLLHLDGYEHAQPVRVGNGAYAQKQHDVWGALLDSIYLHTKSRDGLAESTWEILRKQVDDAIAAWREPDRGIWEVRGEPQHFTSSKVMCWVACDRGARLARLREDHERAERWQQEADDDPRRHLRARRRRARRLQPALRHRRRSTPRACSSRSCASCRPTTSASSRRSTRSPTSSRVDGLVQRYQVEETDDGLAGEEGTFAICSFWLVSALAEIGEHDRARALCEKMLGFASPLNLYAEEIDARSGRHLGNFPQAFTHLALINAVMHVIRADHDLASSQPLLESRREEIITPVSACPIVTRCADPEAVAARVAEVMAAAIDGARTIHGAAHVALSGGSLVARATSWSGRRCPTGATCTCGTATSAACRSTTRSPTTGSPPSTSTRPTRRGTRCPTQLGCDEAAAAYARGDRRRHARRRGQRHGPRRPHRLALPRLPAGPRRRRVRRRPRLAQAAARPRHADAAQAQRLAPDPARRHRRRQGADARARDRGPDPEVPASLLDRARLEIVADAAALDG